MVFPGLRDTYSLNAADTSINGNDFRIGFDITFGADYYYNISTSHYKFSDDPRDYTLYQMQSDLWKVTNGSGRSIDHAMLKIEGSKIFWTVTFPDDFPAESARITKAEYNIYHVYKTFTLDKPVL